MSPGLYSAIEIVWTLLALFGLVFGIAVSIEAWRDYRAVRQPPEGTPGQKLLTVTLLFVDILLAGNELIYLLVGLAAIATPNEEQAVGLRVVYGIFFIVAAAAEAVALFMLWRVRIVLGNQRHDA